MSSLSACTVNTAGLAQFKDAMPWGEYFCTGIVPDEYLQIKVFSVGPKQLAGGGASTSVLMTLWWWVG